MKRRRASSDVLDTLPRSVSAPLWQPPSINRTARLLQAEPSSLGELDPHFLDRLQVEAPELARSAALAMRVADLVRRRSGESPEAWFTAASATPLARFAEALRRDREALIGTITTPWSTSPVEGQNSRLKMLKRTMFGRADFARFRQRVLAAG